MDRPGNEPKPPTRPLAGEPTRRDFLALSSRLAGGGWLAAQLPLLSALSACARDAAERGDPFTTFSVREGETMAALAETILPGGELPGADDAGAVYFVDHALDQLFPHFVEVIRPGLEDLDVRAAAEAEAAGDAEAPFATLPQDRREALVREIEQEPFFQVARLLVVMGMFSDPVHGGNRDFVGWDLLDMERAPAWAPPFGHYDREYAEEADPGRPS